MRSCVREHNKELVAAPPDDCIVTPAGGLDRSSGSHDKPVALRVALSIVDEFQAVEVTHDDAHEGLVGHCLDEPVFEVGLLCTRVRPS
jgi:hypothetical protein